MRAVDGMDCTHLPQPCHGCRSALPSCLVQSPHLSSVQTGKFEFLRLNFYDHRTEDIAWFIYPAFDFLKAAKAKRGRVLIHCVQGVSRWVAWGGMGRGENQGRGGESL